MGFKGFVTGGFVTFCNRTTEEVSHSEFTVFEKQINVFPVRENEPTFASFLIGRYILLSKKLQMRIWETNYCGAPHQM